MFLGKIVFVCLLCVLYERVHAFLCIALWGNVCLCVFFLILSLFFFSSHCFCFSPFARGIFAHKFASVVILLPETMARYHANSFIQNMY